MIQDLYLDGRRDEAIAAVPDELVRAVSLIGPASYVAERVAAFRAAGRHDPHGHAARAELRRADRPDVGIPRARRLRSEDRDIPSTDSHVS